MPPFNWASNRTSTRRGRPTSRAPRNRFFEWLNDHCQDGYIKRTTETGTTTDGERRQNPTAASPLAVRCLCLVALPLAVRQPAPCWTGLWAGWPVLPFSDPTEEQPDDARSSLPTRFLETFGHRRGHCRGCAERPPAQRACGRDRPDEIALIGCGGRGTGEANDCLTRVPGGREDGCRRRRLRRPCRNAAEQPHKTFTNGQANIYAPDDASSSASDAYQQAIDCRRSNTAGQWPRRRVSGPSTTPQR